MPISLSSSPLPKSAPKSTTARDVSTWIETVVLNPVRQLVLRAGDGAVGLSAPPLLALGTCLELLARVTLGGEARASWAFGDDEVLAAERHPSGVRLELAGRAVTFAVDALAHELAEAAKTFVESTASELEKRSEPLAQSFRCRVASLLAFDDAVAQLRQKAPARRIHTQSELERSASFADAYKKVVGREFPLLDAVAKAGVRTPTYIARGPAPAAPTQLLGWLKEAVRHDDAYVFVLTGTRLLAASSREGVGAYFVDYLQTTGFFSPETLAMRLRYFWRRSGRLADGFALSYGRLLALS